MSLQSGAQRKKGPVGAGYAKLWISVHAGLLIEPEKFVQGPACVKNIAWRPRRNFQSRSHRDENQALIAESLAILEEQRGTDSQETLAARRFLNALSADTH